MKDSKAIKTHLAMGWVDYKKAYDMVPHSLIREVLGDMKTSRNVVKLILNSMEKWKTRLECDGNALGTVNIKRGIFQGDSLSPLLFVMTLVPLTLTLRRMRAGYCFKNLTRINHLLYMDDLKMYAKNRNELESMMNAVRIFSGDIGMQFGLDKCAILLMKRGKIETGSVDMIMPNGGEIRAMGENSEYRYLGVLEGDDVKNENIW